MIQYSELSDVQWLLQKAEEDFPDRLPSVDALTAWVDTSAPGIALGFVRFLSQS